MPVKSDLRKPRAEMTEEDWCTYDKTRYTTWYNCAGIIVKSGDKVLLIQDKTTNKWSFPKGAAEIADMENPFITAIRECHEEAGLIPLTDYTMDNYIYKELPHKNCYFFATIVEGSESCAKVNDDDGYQVMWCTREDICAMGESANIGVRHYLNNFL